MKGRRERRLATIQNSRPRPSWDATRRAFERGLFVLVWRARLRRWRERCRACGDIAGAAPKRTRWFGAMICSLVFHVTGVAAIVSTIRSREADYLSTSAPEIRLDMVTPDGNRAEPLAELHDKAPTLPSAGNEAMAASEAAAGKTEESTPLSSETMLVQHREDAKDGPGEAKSDAAAASSESATTTDDGLREIERRTAQGTGASESALRTRKTWLRHLLTHLARHKRDPVGSALRSGNLTLSLKLDRAGHVIQATILNGSGDRAIDEAALAMLRRADPVPPPPPSVVDDGLDFTIPLTFRKVGKD